jgi:hypothetical protein
MRTSENIGDLAAALALAQGEMKHAVNAAENPFFKSKYADLASVTDACRPALSKHGLSVTHVADSTEGVSVNVTARLMHKSGQWIEATLVLKPGKSDPQAIGSAITYARRYTLAALVGVATEDDDGNKASEPDPREAKRQREVAPKPPATPSAGPTKEDIIQALIDWLDIQRAGVPAVIALFKKAMGVEGQLQPSDFPEVLTRIAELKRKGVTKDTLADALKPAAADDEIPI